jgi:uncharacterized protein involved in exopolysaccharide biosynthesis
MQDALNPNTDNEIDLRELFLTLWAYKLFISSTCALGIFFGGYYALTTKKIFTSEAIFKINRDADDISLDGGRGALKRLIGARGSDSELPIDQVKGRIFVEKLDTILNFQADPYFNNYNPNPIEQNWKSRIKRAIGLQESSKDAQEAIWQGILAKYAKNIELKTTKDSSIKIIVTHVNAQRAAKIANAIMNEIITSRKAKKTAAQNQQLSYLSNTVASALRDLEVSQSNLKEFALKNSALPLESFAVESLQLDILREQLSRTSELHEALAALSLILQNKTTDQANYMSLRQQFPIVDQVEFRRVLGQNEIISSWNWPEAKSVSAVYDTMSERKSRLQSQINASQILAERSSLALETYGKLEREAEIAEATYTVLIEQVKAQSMMAGFQPENTEIYEYASASINPSAPNRRQSLVLGASLGLLIGVGLSLVLAHIRGVYYSRGSLSSGAQARFNASVKTLLPLRNKDLNTVNKILAKKPHTVLMNLAMEVHKSSSNQVVVTSSRTKLSGGDVARALACYMYSNSMKVAVINFSSNTRKLDNDADTLFVESFVVTEATEHVSILRPNGHLAAMKLLSQKDFWGEIQSLNSIFDLVLLCADNDNAISLLTALESKKMYHISLAKTKKTKTTTLMKMRSLLPIQGLLYD